MRILLLTPYFIPHNNPRARRWAAIAREWARQGWEVHAVCPKYPGKAPTGIVDGVHVHRTGYNSVKELAYHLFPKLPRRGMPKEGLSKNRLASLLNRLNDWALKSWYWPDDAWLWIRPAKRKAAQLLRNGHWDALISVSLPFSAHWAALNLKKRFPGLRWLADVGDPFSLQTEHPLNNPRLYREKNTAAEEAVLTGAGAVIVTNHGMEKAFRQKWPDLKTPVHVIPPLADLAEIPPASEPKEPGPLHFGYFGRFFKNIREPAPLLDFFDRLQAFDNTWTLHFYGDIFENFLPVFDRYPSLRSRFVFHGLMPREKTALAIREMDRLVLLGNTTSFQLPSKWADYLASGKPVIHLVQTPDDPAIPLAKDLPRVLSLPLYTGNWKEVLDLYRNWKAPEGDDAEWRERLSAGAIAGAYGAILKE